MEIYALVGIIILFLGLTLFFLKPKKRKISVHNLNRFAGDINRTNTLNPNHALLDSHKIFVAALKTISNNQKATAAQTINQYCKRFPNEKAVWRLHRLRNQAAHQTNFEVYEKTASEARTEFIRALKSLR